MVAVTSVAGPAGVAGVFGRALLHAIRKQPAAGDFRVQDMYGGTVHPHLPTGAELAIDRPRCWPHPGAHLPRIDLVEFAGAQALVENRADPGRSSSSARQPRRR